MTKKKPKISLITPTANREAFLPAAWSCIQAQTLFPDFEWLIHDSSLMANVFLQKLMKENPDVVRYFHDPIPRRLGEKRNLLVQEAVGTTIVHIDDDDYYAPRYVEAMLGLLARGNARIVKLFGFYLYHELSGMFGYWDLEVQFPLHFEMRANRANLHMGPKLRNQQDEWGYGFTYVYDRLVWAMNPFPTDKDHGEDQPFATAAVKNFRGAGMQDRENLVVHVLQKSNTSVSYPQQVFEKTIGQQLFPDFVPPA